MITVESLELHVSNHCNLSCRGCSHLTPLESPCFINLDETIKSLNLLKKHLHCKVIRLLGGEPTLNPLLSQVVKEVKSTHIADKISLPTNGLLLHKITDDILKNIDMIEISNYNYAPKKQESIINWAKEIKEKYNIKIIIYMYKYFREPYSTQKNNDLKLTQKIYDTCIVANKWQCFNIYENYIFKCPEAMALSKNLKDESFDKNGLKIQDSIDFEAQLNKYLFDKNHLSACQYCLGTTGNLFPIEQVHKEKYKELASRPIYDLLDQSFLTECLNNDVGDMRTVIETIEI